MQHTTKLTTCMGKKPLPFMKLKWPFLFVSIFFMTASVWQIATKGLNFGIDFKGGTKIVYKFAPEIKADAVRNAVETLGLGDVQVISFGADESLNQLMIRAKYIDDKNVFDEINNKLLSTFGADKLTMLTQEMVGPKVGDDLRHKAFLSIVITCLLILVYVGFRFDFLFAPGAIIALIHDVLISVGFFAFFGKEFNLPILAALLTILGYSINDTIVIYDRVRENIGRLPKWATTTDVIDVSVTETMSRTIVTSLTVFLTVLVMYFMGGGVLHDFAFCLIVGVVFGTYSTVFIASPVYVWLQHLFPNRGLKISEAPKKVAKVA